MHCHKLSRRPQCRPRLAESLCHDIHSSVTSHFLPPGCCFIYRVIFIPSVIPCVTTSTLQSRLTFYRRDVVLFIESFSFLQSFLVSRLPLFSHVSLFYRRDVVLFIESFSFLQSFLVSRLPLFSHVSLFYRRDVVLFIESFSFLQSFLVSRLPLFSHVSLFTAGMLFYLSSHFHSFSHSLCHRARGRVAGRPDGGDDDRRHRDVIGSRDG